MEARIARLARAALLLAAFVSLGADYRSPNFIVRARSPEFARQVAESAEHYRRTLSLEWLGYELPRWQDIVPIKVDAAPGLGAGGATSFKFDRGRAFGWDMSIQGSHERILDSVLPHEILHAIFATHFGGPLPRWADEGACTTVEHDSERAKQQRLLLEFLTTSRGIPFNKMFAMREYPLDILPLYAQGHSVAQFLLAEGGKRKFVQFVERGLNSNRWDAAVEELYGYRDLSDLQLTWVDWVQSGSPHRKPKTPAIRQPTRQEYSVDVRFEQPLPPNAVPRGLVAVAPRTPHAVGSEHQASDPGSKGPTGSWYARQRDETTSRLPNRQMASRSDSERAQPPVLQWNSRAKIPVDDLLRQSQPRKPILIDAPIPGRFRR